MSSDGSGSQPDSPWSSPSGDQNPGGAGEPTLPPPSQPYPASPGGAAPYQPPAHPQPEQPSPQPYQQPYEQPHQQPHQQYPQQPASPYQQPYQQYPAAASPYGVQPYGAPGVFSKPNGKANTAMGLGIASLACAVLTLVCCVTIPGVLCGPFAIGLAISAKKEMDAQPGVFNNPGAAQAGLITGIIGTVLGALMIVLVVAFFGFAISADSMS